MYASAPNDFQVRTKRGKQHYYKKRKQIRYLDIFNIINILILLSADAKPAILLRVSSLTKVEVRNFPLLHFPIWFCLVNGQLAMSLRRVNQCSCLFDIQQWSVLSFILNTTFSITEIPPIPHSLKRFSYVSTATSPFPFFTKMLKALQFFIIIALGGTSQTLAKNVPY